MAVAKAYSLAYILVASKVAQLTVQMDFAMVGTKASKKASGLELTWADSMEKKMVVLREIRKVVYLVELSAKVLVLTLEKRKVNWMVGCLGSLSVIS